MQKYKKAGKETIRLPFPALYFMSFSYRRFI